MWDADSEVVPHLNWEFTFCDDFYEFVVSALAPKRVGYSDESLTTNLFG